jgi:uncharacterized protein with HEPN domain
MSRSDSERFADIIDSIDRCQQYAPYLRSGEHIAMAHDAVLRNLAVIGEAVRGLSPQTREALPDVPWAAVAGLRNVVVHEYFRINPDLVLDIVDDQLSALKDKLQHL